MKKPIAAKKLEESANPSAAWVQDMAWLRELAHGLLEAVEEAVEAGDEAEHGAFRALFSAKESPADAFVSISGMLMKLYEHEARLSEWRDITTFASAPLSPAEKEILRRKLGAGE